MKRTRRFLTTCRAIAPLMVCAALSACVGPNFVPPVPVTAASRHFLDTGARSVSAVPLLKGTSSAPVDVEWWRAFHDPILNRLEARVADENLDVQTATLRIAESRSQVASTAAAALPTLNGNASDYREAYSQNSIFKLLPASALGGAAGQSSPINTGFNNYTIGFDASWELDLWGHVARQVEAADAQLLQSSEMRRDTLVSSLAELARDYVNLRGTQSLIRIAKENLKIEQEILDVTRVRQEKGLVTGLDVESAAAQVESVRAQIPQLEAQEVQGINTISLLLGAPPLAFSDELSRAKAVPPNPPRVPIGLPSELARRRPDIRSAEAQLHAATANIGVAIAEFYPSVRLNGSPTLQALEPKDLFKGTSLQYVNLGPSVTLPIFEGGRLKANLVLQEKRQQEAAIAYHRAVLSAWHDVINALTAYKSEQIRRGRLKLQVDHARQALALARSRYEQGVAEFTTLLDDARTVLEAEQSLAQSTTNVSVDLIALYKALGGGWELTYPDSRAVVPPTLASAVPVLAPLIAR
jgi:NodT family efflux transporter outer membrane factor (OMF) lipoprotein